MIKRDMAGLGRTPEMHAYRDMVYRCHNPSHRGFKDYGARGIFVCQEWRDDPLTFYADMGPRPSAGHSLERIDNNGPYSADNCRWATRHDQYRNRRSNVVVLWQGRELAMVDFAAEVGISAATLATRRFKWPVPGKRIRGEDLLERPTARKRACAYYAAATIKPLG
jgi:hypothetical protein